MGLYLNPNADAFLEARNSEIYIDKSEMILLLNRVLKTQQKYVCVSRPRRFGKSMAANMICAYYNRTVEKSAFRGMKIDTPAGMEKQGKFNVLRINMQEFLSRKRDISRMLDFLCQSILWDFRQAYPDAELFDSNDMIRSMEDLYQQYHIPFVIVIDEWDCIFREYPHDTEAQKQYLDFLRDWLKDRTSIALGYMTGILPIKKYGTHSALNMFTEISMENPRKFAPFTGFTESETHTVCDRYRMDFPECQAWYDGYSFIDCPHIYSPKSVVDAMLSGVFDNYWTKTENYEALKVYIDMNFDGLRDSIISMMAGAHVRIDTGSFQNDMTSFRNADDVMTLLIHLGYLGYDFETKEVFIPNQEILSEFVTATTVSQWDEIIHSVSDSSRLLRDTWNGNAQAVADAVEKAHLETSHLQYNDENALSYTISLAYYAARQYYTIVRELPSGKGFADLVYIPRRKYADKPAMIVELKWDQSADTAISQIHEKQYPASLKEYHGNLLLVGINYDKKTRQHTCRIETADC